MKSALEDLTRPLFVSHTSNKPVRERDLKPLGVVTG